MGECERCQAPIPADLLADYAGARRAMDMMLPGVEVETPLWCEACLMAGTYPTTAVPPEALTSLRDLFASAPRRQTLDNGTR